MSCWKRCLFAAACLGLGVVPGCGGGAGKATFTGTVELDGKAIPEGALPFTPREKGKAPEGARIENGAYSVRIAPGAYTVTFRATKKVPVRPGEITASGEKEKLVSIIPRRYD